MHYHQTKLVLKGVRMVASCMRVPNTEYTNGAFLLVCAHGLCPHPKTNRRARTISARNFLHDMMPTAARRNFGQRDTKKSCRKESCATMPKDVCW